MKQKYSENMLRTILEALPIGRENAIDHRRIARLTGRSVQWVSSRLPAVLKWKGVHSKQRAGLRAYWRTRESVTKLIQPIRQHTKIPMPQAPTAETLRNSNLTFGTADGAVLVSFCPETCTGGVYFREAEMWRLYSPISPQEFLRAVQQQGFEFPSSFVEAAWMAETGAGRLQ